MGKATSNQSSVDDGGWEEVCLGGWVEEHVGESWHFQLAAAGISRVRVGTTLPSFTLRRLLHSPISDHTCCKYCHLSGTEVHLEEHI